jgi:hypothetical protein
MAALGDCDRPLWVGCCPSRPTAEWSQSVFCCQSDRQKSSEVRHVSWTILPCPRQYCAAPDYIGKEHNDCQCALCQTDKDAISCLVRGEDWYYCAPSCVHCFCCGNTSCKRPRKRLIAWLCDAVWQPGQQLQCQAPDERRVLRQRSGFVEFSLCCVHFSDPPSLMREVGLQQ